MKNQILKKYMLVSNDGEKCIIIAENKWAAKSKAKAQDQDKEYPSENKRKWKAFEIEKVPSKSKELIVPDKKR